MSWQCEGFDPYEDRLFPEQVRVLRDRFQDLTNFIYDSDIDLEDQNIDKYLVNKYEEMDFLLRAISGVLGTDVPDMSLYKVLLNEECENESVRRC